VICDDRLCQPKVIHDKNYCYAWVNTKGIDIQPRVKGQNGGPLCFFRWNISVICLTVVLKLTLSVFFSLCFQTFWAKWLHFFVISITFRSLTKKIQGPIRLFFWDLPKCVTNCTTSNFGNIKVHISKVTV